MSGSAFRLKVTVPSVALVYDKKILKQTLRVAGQEVAATTRTLLRSTSGSGRTYRGPGGSAAAYRGGYVKKRYKASSPGQAPVRVTGTLAKSLKVYTFKNGEGVAVRERAFYALFLAKGAKGGGGQKGTANKRSRGRLRALVGSRVLLARPSLETAMARQSAGLMSRVQAAASAGVKMERMRAVKVTK